jgi:PAS domain S-box-containing protein
MSTQQLGKTQPSADPEKRLRARETECAALRAELKEATDVVEAIRQGEVDALLVAGPEGPRVYTLKGAEQPYRIMVESMSEGAATLVADGTLAYANARLAVLLGAPLERLLGQRFADYIALDQRDRFEEVCAAARSAQRAAEFEVLTAAGTTLPARIALSPLLHSALAPGMPPALCLVVTDQTESQRNTELTLEVSRREAAEDELRLSVQQKDAFLAMLAHELRNPLSPIRHASELLTRVVGDEPQAQGLLAMIARQTDHLTRLVDDLLDVARISQNRIVLKCQSLEIGCLIDQAVETVQPAITEKHHQLHINRPAQPLHVYGDRARLTQSLGNLLQNAAKYTDSAGTISLTVTASATEVELEVRDSGIGIAEYLLPRVFDPFVQSERTLDRADGGLGIGLSIVKGLVEMHGGSVAATSAGADRGSTFTIRLPRFAPPPAVVEHPHPRGPCAKRRVLIVDDNVDAADSLALLLQSEGHEAQAAYSASEALETIERLRPEIVLLDIGLPQIDGYEIAKYLRASNAVPGMRLIALTGYGQKEDRERARAAGFDGHLLKPADMGALQQLLAHEAAS